MGAIMDNKKARSAGGSRWTQQRAAISEQIEKAPGFVSAQQLHEELMHAGHSIGLATVYRNLQTLADEGLLDVLYSDGQNLYRSCASPAHHHHLVCRQCGKTVEVYGTVVEDWARKIATAEGFTEVTHTLEMYGLCAECTAAANGQNQRQE
ncbi:MAG: transcriptional repressor [Ancrocorticia sp.]|jgi:Fur family ferric uptake transcriptional regulator|nr:transcriptional repressor [Ancrocorticia sp.]MCI2199641.1 transcriptional repressor [Ancrocorticia sp.]